MSVQDAGDEHSEVIKKRAGVIRDLTTGEGMTDEKLDALGDDVQLFGVQTAEELDELLREAADSLLTSPYVDAIKNALALDGAMEGNLTERRFEFASQGAGVKPRTLIEHEIRGAALLARQVDVVLKMRGETPGEAELRRQLAVQKTRLDVLETLLDSLLQLLSHSNVQTGVGPVVARGKRDLNFDGGTKSVLIEADEREEHRVIFAAQDGELVQLLIPDEDGMQRVRQLWELVNRKNTNVEQEGG